MGERWNNSIHTSLLPFHWDLGSSICSHKTTNRFLPISNKLHSKSNKRNYTNIIINNVLTKRLINHMFVDKNRDCSKAEFSLGGAAVYWYRAANRLWQWRGEASWAKGGRLLSGARKGARVWSSWLNRLCIWRQKRLSWFMTFASSSRFLTSVSVSYWPLMEELHGDWSFPAKKKQALYQLIVLVL